MNFRQWKHQGNKIMLSTTASLSSVKERTRRVLLTTCRRQRRSDTPTMDDASGTLGGGGIRRHNTDHAEDHEIDDISCSTGAVTVVMNNVNKQRKEALAAMLSDLQDLKKALAFAYRTVPDISHGHIQYYLNEIRTAENEAHRLYYLNETRHLIRKRYFGSKKVHKRLLSQCRYKVGAVWPRCSSFREELKEHMATLQKIVNWHLLPSFEEIMNSSDPGPTGPVNGVSVDSLSTNQTTLDPNSNIDASPKNNKEKHVTIRLAFPDDKDRMNGVFEADNQDASSTDAVYSGRDLSRFECNSNVEVEDDPIRSQPTPFPTPETADRKTLNGNDGASDDIIRYESSTAMRVQESILRSKMYTTGRMEGNAASSSPARTYASENDSMASGYSHETNNNSAFAFVPREESAYHNYSSKNGGRTSMASV